MRDVAIVWRGSLWIGVMISGQDWRAGCCGAGESRSGGLVNLVACPESFVVHTLLVDALWHRPLFMKSAFIKDRLA